MNLAEQISQQRETCDRLHQLTLLRQGLLETAEMDEYRACERLEKLLAMAKSGLTEQEHNAFPNGRWT